MALFLSAAKLRRILREELAPLSAQLTTNNEQLTAIMDTIETLNSKLTAVETKLDEASMEIVAEIAKLREQLRNTPLPADAQATLDRIQSKAGALADIVPDAPPA